MSACFLKAQAHLPGSLVDQAGGHQYAHGFRLADGHRQEVLRPFWALEEQPSSWPFQKIFLSVASPLQLSLTILLPFQALLPEPVYRLRTFLHSYLQPLPGQMLKTPWSPLQQSHLMPLKLPCRNLQNRHHSSLQSAPRSS